MMSKIASMSVFIFMLSSMDNVQAGRRGRNRIILERMEKKLDVVVNTVFVVTVTNDLDNLISGSVTFENCNENKVSIKLVSLRVSLITG